MENKHRLNLGLQILIALVLGIVAGILLQGKGEFTSTFLQPVGTIYINLLKFMVVPVVLFSIIEGTISLGDIRRVGSIGWKTFVYYMSTTAVAVIIGIAFATLFQGFFPVLQTSGLTYEAKTANFMEVIVAMFPKNILEPLLKADMLPLILTALLIGLGILLSGDAGQRVGESVKDIYAVIMKMMELVIRLTPIGVFCLMTNVVAVNGASIVSSLGIVLGVAYLAYITHIVVVYGFSVHLFSKMGLLTFLRGMAPAMTTAFTTSSSNATLPLTIRCSNELGADPSISSFVLPLGATINMDGTAIYMGVTSLFIASCYGVHLSVAQLVSIVLTAVLASIGTAGVAGGGMIMLAMVLTSVNLPVEGIALIAGIDRLFDMGRTTLNITGDATAALAVSNWDRKAGAKKSQKK
ncbi:dicarboxylate/amino acid:cation symporter [Murdochiella vaginalis]|uniref:dicarboxylate/amino acid:cation symporter n=1 Tax=Murdochiella vaginalis TaxID=1852373 RepID=UPI0008FDDB5E|nr:dicarboxylate/amino acid:cation symporter [Murdochiella vaginalis]